MTSFRVSLVLALERRLQIEYIPGDPLVEGVSNLSFWPPCYLSTCPVAHPSGAPVTISVHAHLIIRPRVGFLSCRIYQPALYPSAAAALRLSAS